tara:strand:+ start:2088 stop:3248 length:1161 start_codon:yes stop_codon:yes gene_type:complete
MRKFILLIISIAIGFGGIVETGSFYSESLDEERNYTIYLPNEYYDDLESYPVVYFLHGFGGNNNSYNAMHSGLNALTIFGDIIDMIVVSADGSTNIYDGSFYTNSILNGDYEDYIAFDLVDYIDETYRTLATNNYRAVSGHSMGGYGAFRLAMNHSDVFSSFAAHSGPIHLESLNNPFLINMVLIEAIFNGGQIAPDNGTTSMMLFGLSSAFSPNLDNPPWYVDLPINNDGDVDWDVFEQWQAHDPYLLVENNVETLRDQNIYFDCGGNDELQLHSHGVDMNDKLNDLEISHQWVSYSGTHSSEIYDRLDISYVFHSNHFESQEEYLLGDVNLDEVLNILDVVQVVNFILDIAEPNDLQLQLADMNQDSALNVQDVILLINIILAV